MAKKPYTERDVINSIRRNQDISIDTVNKTINILINSTNIGNSTYGKIDYLVKVHDYIVVRVNHIKTFRYNRPKNDNNDNVNYKMNNHRDKLNIPKIVKNTMRKVKM